MLKPVLAERIEHIAQESPSFRAAWDMIRQSGVRVRIGADDQLRGALPRWYRTHPRDWAGVTIAEASDREDLSGAVVAVRLRAIQDAARRTPRGSDYYFEELDRVLIHEIYGHLTPIVASRNSRECLDQHRPGEAACVQLREQLIAAEISSYRQTHSGDSGAR